MTKTKTRLVKSVTLRQIEAAGPCSGEYAAFLQAIQANPIPDGRFEESISRRVKTVQFAPDAPISLAYILGKCKANKSRRQFYATWLLQHVPTLRPLYRKWVAAERKVDATRRARAVPIRKQIGALTSRLNRLERTGYEEHPELLAKVVK